MSQAKYVQRTHRNCVICGKMFNSSFSEALNTFPVYHPQNGDGPNSCESKFFQILLRVYCRLHSLETSLQLNEIIEQIDWDGAQLRKEALMHCIQQGYLTRDNLKRIVVPSAIHDISKDIFTSEKLEDASFTKQAVEYIKSAIIVLREQLTPNDEEEEIEETASLVSESRQIHRMATIERTLSNRKGSGFNLDKAKGMYSR